MAAKKAPSKSQADKKPPKKALAKKPPPKQQSAKKDSETPKAPAKSRAAKSPAAKSPAATKKASSKSRSQAATKKASSKSRSPAATKKASSKSKSPAATKKASKASSKTRAVKKATTASAPTAGKKASEASSTPSAKKATKASARMSSEKKGAKASPSAAQGRASDGGVGEGRKAPAFKLEDQAGNVVRSSDLAGSPYVLYFYPKDNTPGCTQEACDFRDRMPDFSRGGVRVFGVSPDSTKSHASFAGKYGLSFPLLVDDDKKLAVAYGVWAKKQNYGREYFGIVRSTFVIDGAGVVRKVWRNVRVAGHVAAVLAAAEGLR